MRQIRKVKYSDGKVIINYQEERSEGVYDIYTMECSDAPTSEFESALDDLKALAPEWIGLDIDCDGEGCRVSGASFSWKHGIFGGCFCVIKPVASCAGPLVLNMPHKPSEPYGEGGDEGVCLTGVEHDALMALHVQAEKYLDGERAQMELPIE